jgi:predicted RNase H-like HicB family nuclease
MEPLDLSLLLERYENKWVIVSRDYKTVLHFGDTVEEIADHAHEGIIMKVPDYGISYYPCLCFE